LYNFIKDNLTLPEAISGVLDSFSDS